MNKKKKVLLVCVGLFGVFVIAYVVSSSVSNRANNVWNTANVTVSRVIRNVYLSHMKDESPGVGPDNIQIAVADPEHFSFAVMGDTQMFNLPGNDGSFANAVGQITKMKPNFVMTVGDLIQNCDGTNKCLDYKMWKNIAKPILPITYEVMGNHDRIVGNKTDAERTFADSAWQSYFNLPTNGPKGYDKVTYSFNMGNSHFVVLDSEKPKEHQIGQDQLDWLRQDLAANTEKNTFVFYHEPAFPMSYKIGQSLDVFADRRDALWSILDKYNVTAVFNGHEHIFSRQEIGTEHFAQAQNKIYQFIIGNTDALEREEVNISDQVDYYHKGHDFIMVNVDGKEITIKLYSTDGALVDSFSFSK